MSISPAVTFVTSRFCKFRQTGNSKTCLETTVDAINTEEQTPSNGKREKPTLSKCANPECEAPFDYRQGRILRFHKEQHRAGEPAANRHSVQHFWLCEACAKQYTLTYRPGEGVVMQIRSREPELDPKRAVPMEPRLIATA